MRKAHHPSMAMLMEEEDLAKRCFKYGGQVEVQMHAAGDGSVPGYGLGI